MRLNYFSHLQDFYLPEIDANEAARSRKEIVKTLNSFKVKVPVAALDDKALQALPAHVLFAWRHDRDLTLSLFAVPETQLDDPLVEALKTVSNKTYGSDELGAGDERAEAFGVIEAAMKKNSLAKFLVATFEDGEEPKIEDGALDKRFVAAYAIRRAQ